MSAAAIIAEYNPFHTGHAYQIDTLRKSLGVDYILVILSGNYVQRGEPAIFDKWTRTRMALVGGADIVIELPVRFATASAETFAYGAIRLITQICGIDFLCFGSEHENLDDMLRLSRVLVNETDEFKKRLRDFQKQGYSFPKSRELALASQYPELVYLLKDANSILGIEYLKALFHWKSPIKPYIIKRLGGGYHSSSLDDKFSSATALRKELLKKECDWNKLDAYIPKDISIHLKKHLHTDLCSQSMADYYYYFRHLIETYRYSSLPDYSEFTIDMFQRLAKNTSLAQNFDSWIDLSISKSTTRTGFQRGLLHAYLNLQTEVRPKDQINFRHEYIRLLGFKKTASPFLGKIKKASDITWITNVKKSERQLLANQRLRLHEDIHATLSYNLISEEKCGQKKKNDYTQSVVIL